ncbi:hypothetical protein F5J12DRAFT_781329 [Pisolithus orientalis]|uniref:uncharacterized protein n=1 Tax=Pisolithus orientalis TaxID=936130 RepID=UPI002224C7B5|nr:uncharacterized protein F5J12DRAFT_781329 [Pisolithus orientalis]KAI6015333.1 hypothetical protein F5J12DRAFT_781329 [Pisolithus orientalis]
MCWSMPATPKQMPEKTAAHVPEHAMALQEHSGAYHGPLGELWQASHSRANSRANCSTCARACQPLQSKFWSTLQHMCWSTPEQAMALQDTLEQIPEQTVAHVPEHAMALWVNCGKPATPEQMPEHAIVLWATLEQTPEHTAAHVPENTIAFWSTPEQAMALWDTLEQILEQTAAHMPEHTHSILEHSGVNCGTDLHWPPFGSDPYTLASLGTAPISLASISHPSAVTPIHWPGLDSAKPCHTMPSSTVVCRMAEQDRHLVMKLQALNDIGNNASGMVHYQNVGNQLVDPATLVIKSADTTTVVVMKHVDTTNSILQY